jgi:hypothetical protein
MYGNINDENTNHGKSIISKIFDFTFKPTKKMDENILSKLPQDMDKLNNIQKIIDDLNNNPPKNPKFNKNILKNIETIIKKRGGGLTDEIDKIATKAATDDMKTVEKIIIDIDEIDKIATKAATDDMNTGEKNIIDIDSSGIDKVAAIADMNTGEKNIIDIDSNGIDKIKEDNNVLVPIQEISFNNLTDSKGNLNDRLNNLMKIITEDDKQQLELIDKTIDIMNNLISDDIPNSNVATDADVAANAALATNAAVANDSLSDVKPPYLNSYIKTPSQLAAENAFINRKTPSAPPLPLDMQQTVIGYPVEKNSNNTFSQKNNISSQEKNHIKSMDNIFPGKISFADPRVEKIILKWSKDVDDFSNYLKEKSSSWINDSNNNVTTLLDDLDKRGFRIKNKSTTPLLPGEEPRIIKQIYTIYNKLLSSINNYVVVHQSTNKKFFLKENRHKLSEIKMFIDKYEYITNSQSAKRYEESNKSFKDRLFAYNNIKSIFETALKNIEQNNDMFYDSMIKIFKKISGDKGISKASLAGGGAKDYLLILEDDDRVNINDRFESTEKNIYYAKKKIKSYYNINHNMFDVIVDSQFVVLYIIKALRILFTYIALFLATRVFSPIYEDVVYDQKKSPPPLWHYLIIFIGFDISFNVFLIVVLFLLQFLFKTDDNSFMIDKFLFYRYIGDYVLSMIVLIIIGVLISKVLVDKKYFKYKYEGLRAIRAFENLMFNTSIVIYLLPFFLIY